MDEQILTAFVDEIEKIEKIGMSTADVKKKMSAPPTGDTGPAGKGKEDPRFKANVARGFAKKAMAGGVASLLESLKARP